MTGSEQAESLQVFNVQMEICIRVHVCVFKDYVMAKFLTSKLSA